MDIVLPIALCVVVTVLAMLPTLLPRTIVSDDHFGVERIGRGDKIVQHGERGVQPRLLPTGSYWTLRRTIDTHEVVVIPDGCIGVVTSHVGTPSEALTAPYDPRYGVFTDVEQFLTAGGRQGVQEAVLPPGAYTIHPMAFEVIVIDNSDDTYKVYGRQSAATDDMAKAEPNAISTPGGTAVVLYPDSDDNHVTLAMIQVGAADRSNCLIVKFLTSPVATVTIEWEVGAPMGNVPGKEAPTAALTALAREEFDTFTRWSVAEFVAKIQAIEARASLHYTARITEAVMLPRLAMPTK